MRILSVSWAFPYPPDHGTRLREWHLLRRIARSEDVTLLTWTAPSTPPEHVAAVEDAVTRLIAVPAALPSLGAPARVWRRLRWLAGGDLPYVHLLERGYPAPGDLPPADVVVAEDDASAFLMPEVDAPRAVHRHNVLSETVRELRAAGSLGWAKRLRWALEGPSWRRFDREVNRRADLVITTTDGTAGLVRRVTPDARVAVVPNGTVVPERSVRPGDRPCAAFIGTMDYEPNADAAVRLARAIWPAVESRHPGAELRIVGRDPIPRVRRLARPGIVVTGEVPDVPAACDGAWIGIVPLVAGSGLKNKTVELMAMGMPVVTTPVGAEGIRATPEDGLLVFETDAEIADAATSLLSDPRRAAELGSRARAHVQASFSWDAAAATYLEQLRRLAAEAASRPA